MIWLENVMWEQISEIDLITIRHLVKLVKFYYLTMTLSGYDNSPEEGTNYNRKYQLVSTTILIKTLLITTLLTTFINAILHTCYFNYGLSKAILIKSSYD